MRGRPFKGTDEMVAALYSAAAELVAPSRPLELLAELTRSDKAFAARFDYALQRGDIVASFNVEPHHIETYATLYSSQNPWLTRASYFQAEGLVWRGTDIVDLARLKETEFYKLFLYGQAVEHTAHLVVRVRGTEVLHVMLTRRPQAEDYDEAEFEVCRLYTHHARHALEVANAAATWHFVERACTAAVDEMAAGVAVIEPPATILHMNQTFAALISRSRGTGAAPSAHAFSPSPPFMRRLSANLKLPRLLLEALTLRPVPGSCIIHDGADEGWRPIAIEIRPIQLRSGPGGPARSGYILLSRSSDDLVEVDEAALRAAYWLTAAEARVCAALVGGENIHVLSDKLGISPQTARTHLKRIYDKTGTTRQPELLRLLMTFAYRKPPPAGAPRRDVETQNVVPLRPNRTFDQDV